MNRKDDSPKPQHTDVSDGGGRRSSASSRKEMMSGGEGNNNGISFSNNTSDENITADASSTTVRRCSNNNIIDCIPPPLSSGRDVQRRSSLRRSSFNTSGSISVGKLESGLIDDDDDMRKRSSVRFTEDTSLNDKCNSSDDVEERLGGSGPSINMKRRVTLGDSSCGSINSVGARPRRASTSSHGSVLVHHNDKNDSDSNFSFKEFRRSLSILKRSLTVADADFDPDDLENASFSEGEGSLFFDDETDDCDNTQLSGSLHSDGLDDSYRPSLYVMGTSTRSMKSMGYKSRMPLNQCTKRMSWLKSFYRLDPRWQINNFFDDLAHEGVEGIDESGRIQLSELPFIMRAFSRVGVFSIWRPTSNDAIRRMITGEGTGKGLDIKGKSAIRGKWSGFVPFLQIHRNIDKLKVGSLHADSRVRVFYPNEISRDRAFLSIVKMSSAMFETTQRSMRFIKMVEQKEASILGEEMYKSMQNLSRATMTSAIENTRKRMRSGPGGLDYNKKFEEALETKHRNSMLDDTIHKIDDYANTQGCYGLDIPEKLFWETFVSKKDISREDGSEYDTGRASTPEFQVMNLESLRKKPKTGPRPVLWHAGCGKVGEDPPQTYDPLSPFDLLMAYEEGDKDDCGKVTPVVSDFDCFLVGTRRVEYRNELGTEELSMLKWCVDEIEGVLDSPDIGKSWTQHWLEVRKKYAFDSRFQKPMKKMGYADPRSREMMKGAVYSLKENGAVRHGPECFNYSFPQQMDDKFLVISDTLPGLVPWKYVNTEELMNFLTEKIDQGFAFPLNPKWVLCDKGWKELYDKLLASDAPNVQDAMEIWFPPDVRERIAAISDKHPNGLNSQKAGTKRESEMFTADTAELSLQRYKNARSGVSKLRKALLGNRLQDTKNRKNRDATFFSSALTMIQIGKEADKQAQRSEKIKIGSSDVIERLRGSLTGNVQGAERRSSLTLGTTDSSDSSSSPPPLTKGVSRRRSFTRYLRKKLSSKKMLRRKSTA